MARNEAGLNEAIYLIAELRKEFAQGVKIPGGLDEYNPELEKACRVADFIDLGELMVRDALQRRESARIGHLLSLELGRGHVRQGADRGAPGRGAGFLGGEGGEQRERAYLLGGVRVQARDAQPAQGANGDFQACTLSLRAASFGKSSL